MFAVDERIKSEFEKYSILVTKSFDADTSQQKDLTKSFFTEIPLIAALAMINKIENNVKIMENNFVSYCNSKIMSYDGYSRFSPLMGLSSNCVKAGDKIEVTAGVGYFSTLAKPIVTIDRKIVPLDPDGIAFYKFKTASKAGKYSMPIKIEYTQTNGIRTFWERNIDYTVIEEK
jgi:hypothetical protein